jgi:DNA/RNA-binding domain of Phe-tRNA-synthetase-like protein
MQIEFSNQIIHALGRVRLGILNFNCVVEPTNKLFWSEIEKYSVKIQSGTKLDEVNKIETIASARAAYKKCGKDPNRYRPSADSLIRRIVKGNDLYKVNNIVDILNSVSIQSGFSIGGYDSDKICGTVKMDIGASDDNYTGIGRGDLNIDGLPVLRDSKGVFGSPTSDSERTMITSGTTNCIFVFFDFGISEKLFEFLDNTVLNLGKYSKSDALSKSIINF